MTLLARKIINAVRDIVVYFLIGMLVFTLGASILYAFITWFAYIIYAACAIAIGWTAVQIYKEYT